MTNAATPIQISSGLDVLIARRRAGLKQYQLAQLLSISPTVLCDIEHDRRVLSEELTEKIIEALNWAAAEKV